MTNGEPRVYVQAAPPSATIAGVASDAIGALRTSPVLLLIVLLNMVFATVGGYYLLQVEAYRAADRQALAGLLEKCIVHTVPIDFLDRPAAKSPKGE